MSLLRELSWKTKYDSDELSLVSDFYVPVLQCAVRYDRSTGYFTSRVLTLAARGIEGSGPATMAACAWWSAARWPQMK